ncbi:MAG TPA: 30S ribosomal protein S19 [Alphaproteobacteria bacterium]|nr:30S ribosomal protein S19 [Alphaproteobacteria bacterium]
MAKKIWNYRGKSLEDLQSMSLSELSEMLPSRQRRSIKRGFDDSKKKVIAKLAKHNSIETHVRDMIVLPQFVGKTIKIHNGKEFVPVIIQEDMIGCFFGELSQTRRKVAHSAPGVGATKSSSNLSVK